MWWMDFAHTCPLPLDRDQINWRCLAELETLMMASDIWIHGNNPFSLRPLVQWVYLCVYVYNQEQNFHPKFHQRARKETAIYWAIFSWIPTHFMRSWYKRVHVCISVTKVPEIGKNQRRFLFSRVCLNDDARQSTSAESKYLNFWWFALHFNRANVEYFSWLFLLLKWICIIVRCSQNAVPGSLLFHLVVPNVSQLRLMQNSKIYSLTCPQFDNSSLVLLFNIAMYICHVNKADSPWIRNNTWIAY